MIPKPVQRARRLIRKYGYESPDEIDLIDLLYAEGLYLKYEQTDRYQGKIVFNKHAGIITLNLNLENEYQKRYVIAHEMGHFFNEKFKIRNDNPDIENRDAENAIRNEKSCLAADKLEIRNDKLRGKDRLESMAGGQDWNNKLEIINDKLKTRGDEQDGNEKFKIRNDKPDIENRDAENAIRNEKSCLAADKLEIRNDKLRGKDKLEDGAGGQIGNEKLKIINDKLKVCQDGRFSNERALTQSRNKIWTRPLPEGEEVGYTQYNSGLQNELIVHEFKRDRYHDFMNMDENKFEELKREKEANLFAVELLMGRRWFEEYAEREWSIVKGETRQSAARQAIDVKLLAGLAEEFRVSLTAAALRFAELYKGAMAVILSKDKRIEWMACNKNFEYGKLNKYEPVPLNTRTYDIYDLLMPTNYVRNKRIEREGFRKFLKEQNDYKLALDETITVHSSDWFEGTDGNLNEIDFAMQSYNSVLTLLCDK